MSAAPNWLTSFAEIAASTDGLKDRADHRYLLAAGLMGEAGSVLAEMKKQEREQDAYPEYRQRIAEELGDFMWYFVRLVAVTDAELLNELEEPPTIESEAPARQAYLELGAAVGNVLGSLQSSPVAVGETRARLLEIWAPLRSVASISGVELREAVHFNAQKIRSRWPQERTYHALFDDGFPEEEQLPRRLDLNFREQSHGSRMAVIVSCNGVNVGDQLTDNILDPDGYRYHDIFHFAHAVHLGWSPVVRAVLNCKRKSDPRIDEAEDGARAAILEEAVSATVFNRAKRLGFFHGLESLDYGLLKTIQEFVDGYEVAQVPLWQWEMAILQGYSVFRRLRENRGGRVVVDLRSRRLEFARS